jgi:hypothetical protein
MEELKNKQPYEIFYQKFNDGSERGVFAAQWPEDDFDGIEDFIKFLVKYSSAMQDLIQFDSIDEAEDWYSPVPDHNIGASNIIASLNTQNSDALAWLRSNLAFIDIPWLKDNDYGTLYVLGGEDWPELIAKGDAGFLNIFVADSLYCEAVH